MASTVKTRVIGPGVYPRFGANIPFLWQSDNASVWAQMPAGETAASMATIASDNGIGIIRLWCHGGDRASYRPDFEPRPGEFNHGGATISRDGNGDITTTLYNSSTTPPASNIKDLLDAYWAEGVRVSVDLCAHWMLTVGDQWDHNPYKQNCLNAANNVRATGTAGWLTTPLDFFTDATAKAYFKNRIDAWLYSYGDHDAVETISLGNEFSWLAFGASLPDFFDWVEEMSTYLYNAYGSKKPAIGISMFRNNVDDRNNMFSYLYGPSRVVSWHSYGTHYELPDKQTWFDYIRSVYDTFSFEPAYPGELHRYKRRLEEFWGFGAGPTAVPPTEVYCNIQGDPILKTYAYKDTPAPDNTVSPYPHERMWAFLAMAMNLVVMRWPSYIDGVTTSFPNTCIRIQEIFAVAKDFLDTCPYCDDYMEEQWEDNISSSGTLDFKAACKLEDICVPFVLIGSGNQTVDFGVTGTWLLVTYAWEGDGADNALRIVDDASVNGAAVSIAFGDYTDGFCPGYLLKSADYRNIVECTITTNVEGIICS